jgi:hypothetical protein
MNINKTIDDDDVLIHLENYYHPLIYQYEGNDLNHQMDYQ